jgi:hypothetical protein
LEAVELEIAAESFRFQPAAIESSICHLRTGEARVPAKQGVVLSPQFGRMKRINCNRNADLQPLTLPGIKTHIKEQTQYVCACSLLSGRIVMT